MKSVVLFLLVLACTFGQQYRPLRFPTPRKVDKLNARSTPYQEKYFTQTLDHFDFTNGQTYQQRYLISDQYWGKPSTSGLNLREGCKGPIFFYSGNEGSIDLFWDNTGFVTDTLAPEFGALLLFAEHRYYGLSMPFGNNSFDLDKVGYLTSEQALADFAVLIPQIQQQMGGEDCPVITFGGSYGGMLSAWLRQKFPQVVEGAIAASAPILQFTHTGVSQWIFNEIATADFTCADSVRKGFQKVNELGQTAAGRTQLSQQYKLCQPLQSVDDVYNFINWVEGGLTYMAMIDYPYPSSFLEPVPGSPVNVSCDRMEASLRNNKPILEAFYDLFSVYYNYTGAVSCYNIQDTTTNDLGTLGWDYQACTEMVMPMGQNGTSDMFLPAFWDYPTYREGCQKRWGVTPRPNWIIDNYGGRQMSNGKNNVPGTNIVFSNGMLDPWRGGGVQYTISEADSMVAILIDGGAHHLDLRSPNPQDPQSVTQARKKEVEFIHRWVHEHAKRV